LLDEIQYLKHPSNFLKLLYDEHAAKVKIIASGSSAFNMDDHFRDSLAGRKRIFNLLTCSFDEYLQLRNKEDLLADLNRLKLNKEAKSARLEHMRQEWEAFMIFGGYPAVITEPDKNEKIARLREIRDSFVKRDILESGIRDETSFYHVFKLMAEQSGNMVNLHELSLTLRTSNVHIKKYLQILQKCFHLSLIKPYFKNLRKELTKMPKAFLLDTGLRNCLLNNFQNLSERLDRGQLWVNSLFRVLADRYGLDSIFYWRTADGNEIDFILPELEKPFGIEAKFDHSQIRSSKYRKFTESYPEIPLHFTWLYPFDEDFFRRLHFGVRDSA
jgi:predicted AAA+ superfamily ATPase